MVYDDDLPYQINVTIVSSPADTDIYPREVTLLCDTEVSLISRQVEALFIKKGFRVEISDLEQKPPESQAVISLVDLAVPFFDEISAEKLSAFQRYVGNLKSAGMLWATRSAQVGCKDPRHSQILGIARTARSELSANFATFEVDTVDSRAIEALYKVFDKFQRRVEGAELDPDWEFALFEGEIEIPRYHWVSVSQRLSAMSNEELPRKLDIEKSGVLQSLRWVQDTSIILTHDQVEIEPRAVGLNFKVGS